MYEKTHDPQCGTHRIKKRLTKWCVKGNQINPIRVPCAGLSNMNSLTFVNGV